MKIGKIAAGVMAIALVAGVARNARAQAKTLEAEQSDEDLHDAEAAAKRHRAELMKIPHVRVVTGEVDGQNEAAILVEVDEQKNIDAVTRQLPSQIEGFPVEVDESEGAVVESTSASVRHLRRRRRSTVRATTCTPCSIRRRPRPTLTRRSDLSIWNRGVRRIQLDCNSWHSL